MNQIFILSAAVFAFTPIVSAWGNLGHETIAYIAQDFVSSQTAEYVKNILNSSSSSYMASVATWADQYRETTAGSWSEPLHFIDANDSPPSSCNVKFSRDCTSNMCVVAAITNYTSQLQSNGTSDDDKFMAMKFVIHFIGDIHQPLHDEAIERGGNEIDVLFRKEHTNLHHIWDTEMVEKLEGGTTIVTGRTYATNITSQIKGGSLGNPDSWISGLSLDQATVMTWATQANAYVCTAVMPNGQSSVENTDLSTTYYDGVNNVIELQFARAGYRLASWLNLIATGSTGIGMSHSADSATAQNPLKGTRWFW